MSATIGTSLLSTIFFNALDEFSSGTDTRTIFAPASTHSAIWSDVASTSVVGVFVIVCTDIGAPPPTRTEPTLIARDSRRAIFFHGLIGLCSIAVEFQARVGSRSSFAQIRENKKVRNDFCGLNQRGTYPVLGKATGLSRPIARQNGASHLPSGNRRELAANAANANLESCCVRSMASFLFSLKKSKRVPGFCGQHLIRFFSQLNATAVSNAKAGEKFGIECRLNSARANDLPFAE